MKSKLTRRMEVVRKLGDRRDCLLALRDARSGHNAHHGWLDASAVFKMVKTDCIDPVQEALEYLADKGYVEFREQQSDFSELPVVVQYRIVAHGQDLLDGVIEDDRGVSNT